MHTSRLLLDQEVEDWISRLDS